MSQLNTLLGCNASASLFLNQFKTTSIGSIPIASNHSHLIRRERFQSNFIIHDTLLMLLYCSYKYLISSTMSSYEQGIIGFRRPITWEDSSSTKNSSAT